MNQNYFEPNPSYSGFDQPSQYPIDQSPPQEISINDMKDLKQQYLDEMKSMINQIQIKDYRNERIDIRYRRECEIKIGELNGKFNGMSIKINKKKVLRNDSLSLPKNESFHFDRYYDPSPSCPPAKPPDDDGIHFDIEPDTRILTAKVVDDISEHYVLMPSILTTHPTRCPVIDTLLLFSSENENKVFNYGILFSSEEKSLHLLSHRGFKAYQIISNFSKSPIDDYGKGTSPIFRYSNYPFLS
ncbi:hypothetical protein Tco_1578789 [Tanacetum coccineum]